MTTEDTSVSSHYDLRVNRFQLGPRCSRAAVQLGNLGLTKETQTTGDKLP